MKFCVFSFFSILSLHKLTNVIDGHGSHLNKVLLISFDGFRHDYFEMVEKRGVKLKYFNEIFLKGTKADHINNLFITRTFPNHMSIITGCFEESHGIIDNVFFDPLFNETFTPTNVTKQTQSKWFSDVEPLWVTNQKNGHKSAVIHWPGQLAPYRGIYRPSYNFGVYTGELSLNYKIDVMIDWLKDKETTLGILYHPHPDLEGHKYGPNSAQISRVISQIDDSLGYLLKKMKEKGLMDMLNVVVVSDHGMKDIQYTKKVVMDQYLDPRLYFSAREESYALWGLWPKPNVNLTAIVNSLHQISHISWYLKADIPQAWRYSNNRRVAPVIVIADEGWVLVHRGNETIKDKGTHGFKISSNDMKGIFFAWGPDIATNNKTDSIVREIDIFPLISKILKFNYIPTVNGSLSHVQWILRNNEDDGDVLSSFIMVSILSLLCVLAICIMISCAHYHTKSIHLQRVSETYALQTGKLVRVRRNNNRKGLDWIKYNKNQKKPKTAAADTAFLLESSSAEDDEILGDVGQSIHKYSS